MFIQYATTGLLIGTLGSIVVTLIMFMQTGFFTRPQDMLMGIGPLKTIPTTFITGIGTVTPLMIIVTINWLISTIIELSKPTGTKFVIADMILAQMSATV
jgi:hypothetical protein